MAEIHRNLEQGGGLFINKFWTGWYANRSPLYTPLTALGVTEIARQDALWTGTNMMVSPQFTLRRRYGFSSVCPVALAAGEYPLDWFSFEDINGNILQVVDTNLRVCLFTSTTLATLYTKAATAGQSSFNSVVDTMYWVDGNIALKYNGPNLALQSNTFNTGSGTGFSIVAPWQQGNVHTMTGGQTDPLGGTTATTLAWSVTGPTGTLKQVITPSYTPVASNTFTWSVWMKLATGSANTVTLLLEDQVNGNVIGIQSFALTTSWVRYTLTATFESSSTGIQAFIYNPTTAAAIDIYAAQLELGSNVSAYQATTTQAQGVSLMGIVAPTVGPTLSYTPNGTLQPLIGFSYGYCFKNPVTGQISSMSPASANTGPLNNKTVTEKHTVPATGPYTITVTNGATMLNDGGVVFDATSAKLTAVASGPTAGQYIAGVPNTGTYTFSSTNASAVVDITYAYSLVASTGVNIVVTGDASPDPQATIVQIYRTEDGEATYLLDAEIANPFTGTWSYTDSTPDANLNEFIVAPQAGVNDPPPAGASLLVWYGGRLFLIAGNTLYFSAGPDATNGVGEECWPAANNFAVPGNGTALAATSSGLIVWTKDDAYVSTGTSSTTFTVPNIWQENWGVRSQNAVGQDGDNLWIFTSQGQAWNFSASGKSEDGFMVASQPLNTGMPTLSTFNPAKTYITVHRTGIGEDEGVFISDGSATILRYSQVAGTWDLPIVPVGGCGAIASIELADGAWHLTTGSALGGVGAGYQMQRDTTVYTDLGSTYPANAVIGSITVAPPGQTAGLQRILLVVTGGGVYPTLSVLLNEVKDLGTPYCQFVVLPNPVAEPAKVPLTQSISTRSHSFKYAQSPTMHSYAQHLQIKVDFGSEDFASELLGLGID